MTRYTIITILLCVLVAVMCIAVSVGVAWCAVGFVRAEMDPFAWDQAERGGMVLFSLFVGSIGAALSCVGIGYGRIRAEEIRRYEKLHGGEP